MQSVISQGSVSLLDLVFIGRRPDGTSRQVDVDEKLEDVGLEILSLEAKASISDGPLSAVAEKGPSDLLAGYFRARLTAETSARNDAVVIDVAMPAPHTVTAVPEGPVTEAST